MALLVAGISVCISSVSVALLRGNTPIVTNGSLSCDPILGATKTPVDRTSLVFITFIADFYVGCCKTNN